MKDVIYVYEVCVEKLEDIGIKLGTIKCVKENPRLRSTWGRCTKKDSLWGDMYEIEISSRLLQDEVDDKATETTMLHELLHTCEGCLNHGPKWKALAKRVNQRYGYNIKRTTSSKEKGVKPREIKYKYRLICDKCNKPIYKQRLSEFVKFPEIYEHNNCGGHFKRDWSY